MAAAIRQPDLSTRPFNLETERTVTLTPEGQGTRLYLSHRGFVDAAARDQHAQAWPMVLEQMESRLRIPS